MSLRMRLVALVALALLVSLTGGSALVGWHEANSVQTELRAALDVGMKAIQHGFDSHIRSEDWGRDLRRLVDTFDGNRHAYVTLLDERDQRLAASELPAPATPAPNWFRAVVGGQPSTVRVAVPDADRHGATVQLVADPANEVSEVWAESRDAVLVLAIFALLTALLVSMFLTRALRPLDDLSTAFQQMGTGDFHQHIPEQGSPELRRLASGFNAMAAKLAAADIQNRRLNEQLLTLQAEERADLARDLHDEIGPMLFAVDMTAAAIERLADAGRTIEISAHATSIHDAVDRMQGHVRNILERLRPLQAIGLETAISRLVGFWETRRPDIRFIVSVTVDGERIHADAQETIYRVAQEAVSNAVRHSAPTQVSITIAPDRDDAIRVEVSDDGKGMAMEGAFDRGTAGLGLIGMRERVMTMAGSLMLRPSGNGRGLTLVAVVPCHQTGESHEQEVV